MALPFLVGGIAIRSEDLIPSLVFVIIHGLLIIAFIYRLVKQKSRTSVIGHFLCFTIERTVFFSLRSAISYNVNTESSGLSEYMQATLAAGYVFLLMDLAQILRTMLVTSTYPTDTNLYPLVTKEDDHSSELTEVPTQEDQPKTRFWFRRMDEVMGIAFISAVVIGSVANEIIFGSPNRALFIRMRYASTIIALVFNIWMVVVFLARRKRLPQVSSQAASLLLLLNYLLMCPSVYRLIALGQTAEYANTSVSKAMFYIFHVAPETLACIIMVTINVRQVFKTGRYGDNCWRDKKPKKEEAEKGNM